MTVTASVPAVQFAAARCDTLAAVLSQDPTAASIRVRLVFEVDDESHETAYSIPDLFAATATLIRRALIVT